MDLPRAADSTKGLLDKVFLEWQVEYHSVFGSLEPVYTRPYCLYGSY